MAIVDEQITINRDRADVFAYQTAPENQTTISSAIAAYDGPPPAKGTRSTATIRAVGRTFDVEMEVAEYEENERMVVRSVSSPVPFVNTYTWESVDGGTRFRIHQDVEDVPGFWGKLAIPVVTKLYTRSLRADMEAVKAILESE